MSKLLIIPDLHMPYHHQDAFRFLVAVNEKYQPDHVINVGDEVDKHGLSFHDSDPDLPSAGDELKLAKKYIKRLGKLFPIMDLVDSNHGSLAYRKAKAMGMPSAYIKPYGEVLEAPKGWTWYDELILQDVESKTEIMVRHQFKKNPLICAQQMGMCVIQGHFHEDFNVQYVSSPNKLLWALTVGCLIDKRSLAFTYNKTNYKRPILGCSVIIDGQPILIPMYLDKKSRWTGRLV